MTESPNQHPLESRQQNNKLLIIGIAAVVIISVVLAGVSVIREQQEVGQQQETHAENQASVARMTNQQATPPISDEDMSQDLPPIKMEPVTADASLMLVSLKESYQVGELVEITLQLNSDTMPDGVQYVISYNPAFLSDVRVEPVNSFGSFVTNRVDTQTNEIKGMLLREPQEAPNMAEVHTMVKILGTAAQSGSLLLQFNLERTEIAAAGGQDVLSTASDLSVIVN